MPRPALARPGLGQEPVAEQGRLGVAALASEPHVPARLLEGREEMPLPVKRGGGVLFHKMNLHRALPNRSSGLRWSMDLRYQPTGQPTGRPAFPGFVARSRANPDSELKDPAAGAQAAQRRPKRRSMSASFSST